MAQLVPVEDAARNTLASWLRTELGSVTGVVSVESFWMEADRKLPAKQISIINRGPRSVEWLQPEVLASANIDLEGGAPVKKADVTWALAVFEQPLQLDVWARSEPEVKDILARLDASLNKGERGLGIANSDPFRAGLLRPLGDGWGPGIVDFLFESPDVMQSPDSQGRGEFRAMYRGRASGQLTQSGRSPRLARILLEQRLRETEAVPPADTTIILPTT